MNQKAMEAWLEEHGEDSPGFWLKIAKKGTGVDSVTYDEAVESSLCFGWIDGLARSFDATFYVQRFTPRKPKSLWSLINTKKVKTLEADGRLRPAGKRAIAAAKKDGRWKRAYAGSGNFRMPKDFLEAMKAEPECYAFYRSLSRTNQYSIYFRLRTAMNETTRQNRFEKCLQMLRDGETFH